MLKSLQARLQQYVNHEIPDVHVGFRKGRGVRDQIANICCIIDRAREFQKKHILLLYWLHQSLWLCGSQQTVKNSSRDGNTRPPYLPSEKSVCRSRSNSENMDQWTGSKLGKEYVTAVYCHPDCLAYMQSTSHEMLGWMKLKLELRLQGEISITSDTQMTPPVWQKVKN